MPIHDVKRYPVPLNETGLTGVQPTYPSGTRYLRLNDTPSSVLALSLEASFEIIAIAPAEHNLAKASASFTSDGKYVSLSSRTSSSPLKDLEVPQASKHFESLESMCSRGHVSMSESERT
jgi:hypothetical protein